MIKKLSSGIKGFLVKKYSIALLLIAVLILLWLISIIRFPHNYSHELFLRYILTLNSWPFAILILGILLLFQLGPAIIGVINRGLRLRTKDIEVQLPGQAQEIPRPLNKEGAESSSKESEIMKEVPDKHVGTELEKFQLAAFFEQTIRYMFRSQFNLLSFLRTVGPWPTNLCYELYYTQQYLKLYHGSPDYGYEKYIGFLIGKLGVLKKVFNNDVASYELTPLGKRFVEYCGQMKYAENEFRPL